MLNEKRREREIIQLAIEMPKKVHSEIKVHAALRNISMRKWVIRTLLRALKAESGG